MKKLLFLVTLLLLAPFVLADGLDFSDMDVEVENDSVDDVDKDGGSFEAAPGDLVELTIEVENTFDVDTEGHKIESIDVEIEIGPFCPDDLDEEIQEDGKLDDLDPGEDDSITFRFYIPDCADEDNYDLDITVDGKDDDDGTKYKIAETILVQVEKVSSDVTLDFGALSETTLSCVRTFETEIEVHNIGALDQDAGLLIINNDIGINKFEFLELRTGDYDEEDTYHIETYKFTIDDDVAAGEYQIRAEVEYGSNSKEVKRYQTLIIEDCGGNSVDDSDDDNEEVPEEDEEQETITVTTGTEIIGEDDDNIKEADESEVTETESEEEYDDAETFYSVPLLISAIIVAVLILLLMAAMIRKK